MRELLDLKGVGEITLKKLNKLGISNIDDLINFLPINYIDLDSISTLQQAEEGVFVLLKLKIIKVSKPFSRGRLSMFSAWGLTDDLVQVKLTWFNSNYICKFIAIDKVIRCYAKLTIKKGVYQLVNPIYENYESGHTKFKGIKPIYPTKGVIAQSAFFAIMADALKDYQAKSFIPESATKAHDLLSLDMAYKDVHSPQDMAMISLANERITLERLVKMICAYKHARDTAKRGHHYQDNKKGVEALLNKLPYTLTPSQKTAVDKIIDILLSPRPLNTILVGDVGSGKTIVALVASYFAVLSHKQVGIMSPTEILALQHFNNFTKILNPLGVRVGFLSGSMSIAEKREIHKKLAVGDIDILIGTHAIISKGVKYKDLSLIIVDEQHRFGVAQRTALIDKGKTVDTLTLSATPIPRSLRLTMLGETDILSIERRHDNTNITTAIVGKHKKTDMLEYIVSECKKGKQAYLVAPKIYDDEGIDTCSVEKLYEDCQEQYGKDISIALLHGKIKAQDKKTIISDFNAGRISILISTTVIEVGIDVPNASLMVIFNAENFGLATLHQLRGRIGRDGSRAYCFLYTEKDATDEIARLNILSAERDGMSIAENDYQLRGGGEWLGENQSGKGAFRPSIQLINLAKKVADSVDMDKEKEYLARYAQELNLKDITLN